MSSTSGHTERPNAWLMSSASWSGSSRTPPATSTSGHCPWSAVAHRTNSPCSKRGSRVVSRRPPVGERVQVLVLGPPVLRVVLVVVQRHRQPAQRAPPAVPDHPEVPDLVADLADPRLPAGVLAPRVGQGRQQQERGIGVPR